MTRRRKKKRKKSRKKPTQVTSPTKVLQMPPSKKRELELGVSSRPPPAKKPARRQRVQSGYSGSGLLDTVPSGMTFKQQMEMALVQSKRDAIRQERRARAEQFLGANTSVTAQKKPVEVIHMDSGSESSASASPSPSPSMVHRQETSESMVDEFVIQEAPDIMELEGFNIMAASSSLPVQP